MAPPSPCFLAAAPLSRTAYTGASLRLPTTRNPPRAPRPAPVSLSLHSYRLRLARIRSHPLPPTAPPNPPSSHAPPPAPLPAVFPSRPSLPAAVLRPARHALAFAARLARRTRVFRRRHPVSLRLARLSLGLAVAAVSYVVTRGALSGVATVPTAPALPQWPVWPALPLKKLDVPARLRNVLKPFTEAFGVVFLSEFGDKSMFATALMAMKHSPIIVCVGALAALTLMTFIACFLGQLMHLLPATITHYSTIALFVFFGLQMILQARHLPDTPGGAGGERADAEELVAEAAVAKVQNPLAVLAKVSSLIFVAEWCDRSMLATMALAASSNTVAVIGGATFANILCTAVAVGGAAVVASRISERMVALVAGILFEFFAVFTYFEGPEC